MRRYGSYKDSGIEWIGEIPVEWKIKKLNYCFNKIGSGTTPTAGKSEYYEGGEFNWLQTGDLNDGEIFETSKKVSQKALDDHSTLRFYDINSLVIAMYGATIGKTGILKIETTTNQACCVLSEPKDVYYRFAFYWLNSVKEHVISLSYGGGQPNINQEQIRSLRFPLPPLLEQTAIANYLDRKTAEIDQLIADKKRLLELYEEEKTAIINQAVTKGLDPNVPMKDSGIEWLGEIPEHWEVNQLRHVVEMKSGNGITSESIQEYGEFPVYGGNGLRGYFHSFTHKGSYVLIGRQGALCGNINYAEGNFWASEHAIVCHPRLPFLTKWFGELLRIMNLNQYSVSAAQPGLSVEKLKSLRIPVPPVNNQQEIVYLIESECGRIDAKVKKNQKLIDLLAEYRTALISEVVTGKIKVTD